MKTYKITKFSSFTKFKDNVGFNNQLLITSLIGIHKVDESDIKDDNNRHPFLWNPKDIKKTIDRSDQFIRKASLVWIVDCLDSLLLDFFNDIFDESYDVNRLLIEFGYEKCKNYEIEEIKRSVYLKFAVISSLLKRELLLNEFRKKCDFRVCNDGEVYFPELELVVATCDYAIQWRNNLVHSSTKNVVVQNSKRMLSKYSDILQSTKYCNLNYKLFKEDFENNRVPTFKDVAFMIRSLIDFGFCLNAYWIEKVDQEKIIKTKLNFLIKKSEFNAKWNILKASSKERREKYLISTLKQCGVNLEKVESSTISDVEKNIAEFL